MAPWSWLKSHFTDKTVVAVSACYGLSMNSLRTSKDGIRERLRGFVVAVAVASIKFLASPALARHG
jgi:hypothetical protein